MSASRISLSGVNLHYPSTAYAPSSLVTMLGQVIKRGGRSVPLKDIHALKSVTAEIGTGERVALLGHNGAGKSTFLKTVAGLYPISSGRLNVEGSVRSLFDISLGFEPDATGRANILYRCLLMGLHPRYVREREPEIVAFADLGEFIDYPLSTYSAGMQVRLAFAISTFAGGDILLLDEVIGAGDASFMVRARARIAELVRQSEIMVLASHDLNAVESLCDRGLVFHHGELAFDGPVAKAIAAYRDMNGLDLNGSTSNGRANG
ncbi:MAG TPA: ABC transporter ATP-binding protein [Bryobacteraceae bacterium]|jgi:lipopolysaccharide transport system ATP-binding protein